MAAAQSAGQCALDQLVELRIRYTHIARYAPCKMNNGHDGAKRFDSIVLVAFDSMLILAPCQRSNVPRNVVAPALQQQYSVINGAVSTQPFDTKQI